MTVVDDARAELEELRRGIREFFGAVDEALRGAAVAPVGTPGGAGGPVLISPELMEAIRQGVRDVQAQVQPVLDRVQELVDQPGDPERLRQAAMGWQVVGNDLGTTARTVGLDRMRATIEWEGSAAAAYQALVPRQGAQLIAMKAQCLALATSLNALADQIEAFWLAIVAALVLLGFAFAAAVVAAVSVVGIPAAIGALLIAVTGGASAIAIAVQQLNAMTDRIATEQRAMAQSLHDIGATWPAPNPTATAVMADASVTDGDRSEWRPTR